MDKKLSALPDGMLRIAQSLPSPAGVKAFYLLRRIYRAIGGATGRLTKFRFGNIELAGPLNHPALFWRYLPKGFNQNYVLTAKETVRTKNGLIIDVGANIGDGVALLRSNGIDSPILAIEGADAWFELLTSNTQGISDIFLEKYLLGDACVEEDMELLVKEGSSKLVKGGSGVKIATLDNILSRYKDMPVAMLKTDTDGFDFKVLLGAKSLLKEQQPVLFIEVDEGLLRDQGDSSAQLIDYITECGYTWVAVWDNYGRWLEARSIAQGISDLIDRHPGGPETAYLDIAAFSEADQNLLRSIEKANLV